MIKIKASATTYLKKTTDQADKLSDSEKVLVLPGKEYEVESYLEQAATGHTKVALGHGAGEWFIFTPHWKIEQDLDWNNMYCPVSRYFTVGEVLQYDPRRVPSSPEIIENILKLARELDKIRANVGSIHVTSWYRPPAINAEVGGATNSQHIYGLAADIYCDLYSTEYFQNYLRRRWGGGIGYGAPDFVHLDMRNGMGYEESGTAKPCAEWNY